MIALWVIFGLITATVAVSTLGAAFSVIGLAALFSGAALAVIAMATSLEFAKFVLSAYLHQRWKNLNLAFKMYLLFAIVTLSLITSMGIFGFLSDAYQSASSVLEGETLKLESLKAQQDRATKEIERINRNIEEIPIQRVSRRLKARAEAEPFIAELTKQNKDLDQQIAESNLKILEVKQKVGPLIYISRTFKMDIDDVVKYLIVILVLVFDPLAICLVIATSEAIESRRQYKEQLKTIRPITFGNPQPAAPPATQAAAQPAAPEAVPATTAPLAEPAATAQQPFPAPDHPSEPIPTAASPATTNEDEEVLQMRFAPDDDDKNVV